MTKTTKYSNKDGVRKHNHTMIKCRKIAEQIQMKYPELKEEFALLLEKYPDDISLSVAHHIIEVMQYPDSIKAKALSIIKDNSKENSAEGYGNKIWLQSYLVFPAQGTDKSNVRIYKSKKRYREKHFC